ncbi:MAG: hypothetical protein R3E36_07630 [Nitrosomonas sp.]|nr:hypothetical protein [Nitrosomonas sp.]MCP5292474.1 hypothetical protein [Burkholderiales bacterium]MDR4520458.1 hypothetical protein [Nitrosomonas sp.]
MKFFEDFVNGNTRMDVILMIAGALIGWAISHFYYVKALNDFKTDAEEKKRVDELIFRGIESIGTIKYTRDASGKVKGVVIELRGAAASNSVATGDLTVGSSGD